MEASLTRCEECEFCRTINCCMLKKMQVQVKYKVMERRPGWCSCVVFVGVSWLKSCKFEQRITRNVVVKFGDRVREMFELIEREILLESDGPSC